MGPSRAPGPASCSPCPGCEKVPAENFVRGIFSAPNGSRCFKMQTVQAQGDWKYLFHLICCHSVPSGSTPGSALSNPYYQRKQIYPICPWEGFFLLTSGITTANKFGYIPQSVFRPTSPSHASIHYLCQLFPLGHIQHSSQNFHVIQQCLQKVYVHSCICQI